MNKELASTTAYVATQHKEVDVVKEHTTFLSKCNASVSGKQDKLPTMYWIPKLHKNPYKARFIANSSACTTTNISKLLTLCLSAIKIHVQKYCHTVSENSGVNLYWPISNSNDVLDKLKNKHFHCSSVSTYDFSTLYTTLPHTLIKEKLTTLIEKTFAREQATFLACNFSKAYFTDSPANKGTTWTCDEVCRSLVFLLDNIYIRYGNTVYRQVVGIPMGTNCAPLIADLFLYCYERDFMLGLSPDTQSDVIDAFNNTSRYLDDILNLDNPFFDRMFNKIYPPELTLNKANTTDSEAAFLDLRLSVTNGSITTKIYDKRDDFNFSIVNYPHLDGDVPRATSYGVYISQLMRYARASSNVEDFNDRNRVITSKLLQQGYRFHKLRKTFSKFYNRNSDLVLKYNCNMKTLLRSGITHPQFYGDVIYKLRKIKGSRLFSDQFKRIIRKFVHRDYDPSILRRTAGLVIDRTVVDDHSHIFVAR